MRFIRLLVPLAAFASLSQPSHALAIRGYSAAIHNRFNGYPLAPVMNPNFLYTASRFTGVGWYNQGAHEEFALVTPSHFIFARHAAPAVGGMLNFVGSDGAITVRTITAVTTISNDTGGDSDLVVGTLDSPVPSTVSPLPWMNLANENAYKNLSLIVLGFSKDSNGTIVVGGGGTLTSFATITEDGIAATRMAGFAYNTITGGANDCYFEGGDSGSPTFATAASGEVALIGTHSSISSEAIIYTNYDTFLPHYQPKVDALLAPAGYRMRPATVSATTLSLASAPSSASLQQGQPGGATFTVTNSGAALAGNVALTLTFPSGASPDSITMPGWVVDSRGNGVWSLRIATLASGASGTATLAWSSLPAVSSLSIAATLKSDATALASSPLTLTLASPPPPPSPYAVWSQGLSDPSQTGDPDGDGVDNLLEYAFGGDPTADSLTLANGQPLLPQIAPTADGSQLDFSYPERSDATTRGLTYTVQTSPDLITWTDGLPSGATSSTAAFSPPVDGFVQRNIIWTPDPAVPLLFVRLRVELNEGQ